MQTKDLVSFGLAALIFSFVFQYFMGWRGGQPTGDQLRSGQKMTAPRAVVQTPELHQPLNTEIDFLDKESSRAPETTVVDTPLMTVQFSSDGAVVTGLSFKRNQAGVAQAFQTFELDNLETEREQGAFLLALRERTPFYYNFIGKQDEENGSVLTYQVKADNTVITKQFKVYSDKHQIDLLLTIENGQSMQPRLFVPAPYLSDTTTEDSINAIMNDPKNQVQKETRDQQLIENFWPAPTLFGAEDRYFVHAMVEDFDGFALRGFYKMEGISGLSSVIEGQPIKEDTPTTWRMSFYVGPKEVEAFSVVDSRLEATLGYGFWAPVSKVLMTFMKLVYGYLPNYGFVIILLTLLIKLLLLPFGFKQSAAMKSRKELQRKMAYLESKYKDDRETLMREKAELIRKHGMPDMLGCLPVLVQLPLFYALNRVLNGSIELFQAPFLWVKDLSAADPFYIFPLLIAMGMMISLASVGDVRQRLPFMLMSLVIGAITANLAAGLSLFIATSTWLSVAEMRLKKALNV